MLSITSQLCGNSLLAFYLSKQDAAIYRPLEQLRMSDRLKKEALVKANCWTFGYGAHIYRVVVIEIVCEQCTLNLVTHK